MATKTTRTPMKKVGRRAAPKTDYNRITENIYRSNESFRVRLTIDGKRYSKNFTSQRQAIRWRNEMKRTNGAAA
jgi:hypothetical protein